MLLFATARISYDSHSLASCSRMRREALTGGTVGVHIMEEACTGNEAVRIDLDTYRTLPAIYERCSNCSAPRSH